MNSHLEPIGQSLPEAIKNETTPAEIRKSILGAQEFLAQFPQVECKVKHHFSGDSYAREILLPAGSLVIGKIHRHAHVNVISQGECVVLTEEGVKKMSAPMTFISMPGTKRVVYSYTDVVWTTVHVTNDTDLEKIEADIIAPTYNDLDVTLLAEKI